jgi:integrase
MAMSVKEIPNRPGWYNVVVYDRVTVKGKRPAKVQKQVRGQRAAEKVERDLLRDRDRGSLVSRSQTLSEFADHYLASRKAEVSAQTHAGYAVIVDRYIKPYPIGSLRVDSVTVTSVAAFYADVMAHGAGRRGAPLKPATVQGIHRLLSMMLKRATIDGLLYTNPCQVAKPPKDDEIHDEEDEPGVDPETAREFVAAAAGLGIHAIAAVALGSGLRRSELVALRWSDVDLEAGVIDVNGKIEQVGAESRRIAPKTKRSRRKVPIGNEVRGVLQAQRRHLAAQRLRYAKDGTWVDEGWVFPSEKVSFAKDGTRLPAGRLWTPNAVAQEWRRAMNEVNSRRGTDFLVAGGEASDFEPWDFGIHALRHAYATAQLAAGVRDEVVSRRMGHSSSLITRKVYSHVTNAELREGVDVADGLLRKPVDS